MDALNFVQLFSGMPVESGEDVRVAAPICRASLQKTFPDLYAVVKDTNSSNLEEKIKEVTEKFPETLDFPLPGAES